MQRIKILVLLVMTFMVCDVTQAQQEVAVSFKMIEPTITLHEPVRIEFSIRNGLPEQIQFDLGFNRKGNFDFTITEPGNTKKHLPRLSEEGAGRLGRMSLSPAQTYTQILLLNEWYQFDRSGEYEIEAKFLGSFQSQSLHSTKVDQSHAMHLRILPANAVRLKTVCNDLAKVAIESTYVQASEAALALSFMQDPNVVPCLEEVLKKNKLVRSQAVAGLGRIGNREAVRILISTLSSEDTELQSLVSYVLKGIAEKTNDNAIKEMINSALKR